MQLPGLVAFLHTLSDEEAPGPVRVGGREFGTSPPMCRGDSWVSAVPCARLPLPELSPGLPHHPPYCLSPYNQVFK